MIHTENTEKTETAKKKRHGNGKGNLMNAIKIRTRLESDTIRIPELQAMVGKDVVIIVIEESEAPRGDLVKALEAFDHMPVDLDALEELRKDSMI